MTNSLGVDVSKYNGPVHWDVAFQNGVKYTGVRATISWGYKDPWFAYNVTECSQLGIYIMPYHVLYAGESIDRQVKNFLDTTSDWDLKFPVLDLELHHGLTKIAITKAVIAWCEAIEKAINKKPIIYSRKYWINDYTLAGDWRNSWDWWLAAYYDNRTIERPAPPPKPTGVTNWLIHQNCDKKPAWPGFAAGGKDFLSTVDINRWNGDDEAVDKYFMPDLGEAIPKPPHETKLCPCCGQLIHEQPPTPFPKPPEKPIRLEY